MLIGIRIVIHLQGHPIPTSILNHVYISVQHTLLCMHDRMRLALGNRGIAQPLGTHIVLVQPDIVGYMYQLLSRMFIHSHSDTHVSIKS